jgi:hypothetical protein
MSLDMSSFGRAIASARRQKQLSQKELAGKILKEDAHLPNTSFDSLLRFCRSKKIHFMDCRVFFPNRIRN